MFDRFSRVDPLASLTANLGLIRPQVWQNMYIFKQRGIGGEVSWHQDTSFVVTDPSTVTTFWFAPDDAGRGNGCLWVEPGSHRGRLQERFVRTGHTTHLESSDPAPWPSQGTAVPVEAWSGTRVLLHGTLPQFSAANRSTKSRHPYTLEVTDDRAEYSPGNWLHLGAHLPVRGFTDTE